MRNNLHLPMVEVQTLYFYDGGHPFDLWKIRNSSFPLVVW